MHCAVTLLHNRVNVNMQAIGPTEVKLLYTLQWILLFAAEECKDDLSEQSPPVKVEESKSTEKYLFSIPTITLFVYLFAPIIHHLKESDFQNFRLENGLLLWQAMWDAHTPIADCFKTSVKPSARALLASYKQRKTGSIDTDDGKQKKKDEEGIQNGKQEDSSSWVSSQREYQFPETIPEEASSLEEERVVIFRLPGPASTAPPSLYKADASLLKTECSEKVKKKTHFEGDSNQKTPSKSNETSKSAESDSKDIAAANYLDVAVLRCLFISNWQEDGVYWGLHYMYNRLREIGDEAKITSRTRKNRSNSLPIPHIEISKVTSFMKHKTESPPSTTSSSNELSSEHQSSLHATDPSSTEGEKRKRIKINKLKAFVESKVLSKSDRNLEQIGVNSLSNGSSGAMEMESNRSLNIDVNKLCRSASLIAKEPISNLIKGKSMPSLDISKYTENILKTTLISHSSTNGEGRSKTSFRNPIITVTQHSPAISPDLLRKQSSSSRIMVENSDFASNFLNSENEFNAYCNSSDQTEAPGSSFYITLDGGIDYEILLTAVYNIFKRDITACSLRVLETGLNICELLLDLGIIKMGDHAMLCVMGIIKRGYLHLGCPHGCYDGFRGPLADFLRNQCQKILYRLLKQVPMRTKSYLKHMVKTSLLHELVDFFHSFTAFCVDPNSLLSPLNVSRPSGSKTNMGVASSTGGQGGYATNFTGGSTSVHENEIISAVLKLLVSRFVVSLPDLKHHDNMQLYHDIKQFLTFLKGVHGGPYRIVALSGIIDVTPTVHKKDPFVLHTTRIIRHIPLKDLQSTTFDENKSQRKIYFKKRSTSSSCAINLLEHEDDTNFPSQSPISNLRRITTNFKPPLTPKHSEKTLLPNSASSSDHMSNGKLNKIFKWFKGSKSQDNDLESGSGIGQTISSALINQQISLKLEKRREEPFSCSLQKAKRRVERRLNKIGIAKRKKKMGGTEESAGSYLSRRSSSDLGDGPRESEVVIIKERRIIPIDPVREGMARFSFLLETGAPGAFPDAQLIAASMDLPRAPIVTRAAFLLECAHFIHQCNKGHWPVWMKQNINNYKNMNQNKVILNSVNRKIHTLQKQAGKMFYQWGEMLGARLEEILFAEKLNFGAVKASLADQDKQKELLVKDEEEDFLDDTFVNPNGNDCPHALKMIAFVLLYEITSFMRETYTTLPKTAKIPHKEKSGPWEKVYREANRRWSMAMSSMGHSQTSAQSLQSIVGADGIPMTERKISFVLHEPDNESENSSNTTLTVEEGQKRPNTISQPVRPLFLRRGTAGNQPSGSFKRRSLKLRRGTKDGKDFEPDLKRIESIKNRRKVSSLSDKSDTSEQGLNSGEESPGFSEEAPESPTESNEADDLAKNLPWTKCIDSFLGSYNFYCNHKGFCHPYCYKRQFRSAFKLMKAVQKVYGEEFGFTIPLDGQVELKSYIQSKPNRKISEQSSTSSTNKISLCKKNKFSLSDKIVKAFNSRIGDMRNKDKSPMLRYIDNNVRFIFHFPISTLLKSIPVLGEDLVTAVLPIAWELLLDTNQETATSCATFFIVASVKAQNCAFELMQRSLKNKDPNIRIGAIQRFLILWRNRFQVWPRMEEGAHMSFKVPPPGIEFTLPSPKIGIESLPVVDPPWIPIEQTKNMEVALNQERHRAVVTATTSRKKQQTEAVRNALQQQKDKQCAERNSFLITTIPINQQASHEPGLDHGASEDHGDNDDKKEETRLTPHVHAAHSLFPSILCSSVMKIVESLDDAAVGSDGMAVYDTAYHVIWICLVEDSALFLRYVLERLTRDRQDQMFKVLRHLIRFVPRLPQQAAFALYNYIIGYVMFYVRSSNEHSQELVGSALSILWMVVHSVHGIMFKDLKQILRKEQCDASILLTANVPAAKKIVVHGPYEDEGNIPSQFPVGEDTLFSQLLKEALDFYPIDEKSPNQYYLVDYKSNKILNPNWHIRDLYFFKRSQYPQVRLIAMKPEVAFSLLQKQELIKKFVEIGKVHLTWAILKNVDMVVQRVVFLHEELMKLPSFPRKALEADLDLHQGGEFGKELFGLDVLHKFMWVRLIARMFEAMAGNFAYSADIQLFLNVLSGAALLHAEDSCIMRYVMATFINAAFNFKNIFSTNGYFLIMPTLLQVYSLHQTNKLITTTIEYAVKQFYLLNRKPFILQMFGSVSAILDTDEDGQFGEAHKVQSSCLFNLLLSLEDPSPDPLNIAELVKEPKPLKAIDFCYHDEDGDVTVLDCITLCVMTVSYAADSTRGYQMMIILEAILPCYLQQIQSPHYTNLHGKPEKEIILQLAVAIRTMVHNCEGLSKSYNGPYRSSPEHKGSSQRNYTRGMPAPLSPGIEYDEESHSKYVSDTRNKVMIEGEDSEMIRSEYRRPRDVLLSVVGDFLSKGTTRLQEINKKLSDVKVVELVDAKCHIRLADIAHSLLKVSPYDPESMACQGLQRYMLYILPRADWSNDSLRNTLTTILRRVDKVFQKISKKASIRRNTDWEAASGLLKGIHETTVRHPYVLHWQNMKALISTVQNLIINDHVTMTGESAGTSSANAAISQNPPAFFCSTVVRLVALQVISPVDCFSLESICGGSSEFTTQEKAESFLMNLLVPLCFKVCSVRGSLDIGELKQEDISFLLTAVLNAMSPPAGRTGQGVAQNRTGNDLRAGSLTFTGSRDAKRPARISGSLYQAAFLALRIICISFENRLANDWSKIVRVMRDLGRRNEAAPDLWSFLEFVVTHRTPLSIVLMPFILHKISQPPIGDRERQIQFIIRERLRGTPPQGGIKSKGALLVDLTRELRDLREELEERRFDRENVDHGKKEANPPAAPNSETHKNQQRPSLISIFTGTGTAATSHSHFGSVVQMDSRSASGVFGTPSDTLSSHTLHPQKEMSSSTSGTTTTRESESIQSNENTAVEQRTTTTVPSSISSNVLTTAGGIFKHQGPKLRKSRREHRK
ncbi:unc-80 family protein [Megaselia abdita]